MCHLQVLFLSIIIAVVACNSIKDSIGFPESEENMNLKNKDNRMPVYVPARCPPNELFYPGDQKDDWICDCRPAHIYHPQTDACWPAFEQGPCAAGEYLVLPQNSVLPVCKKNPCNVDKFVLWNSQCVRLGSTDSCQYMYPNTGAIGVNATTLLVGCIRLNSVERTLTVLKDCPLGCKRNLNGQCEPI